MEAPIIHDQVIFDSVNGSFRPLWLLIGAMFILVQCTSDTSKGASDVAIATPSYQIVEGHAPVWELATKQLLEMADAMPEDLYGYRPHDSVQTFAEQLVHIVTASKGIANFFMKDERSDGPPPSVDVSSITREELKALIRTQMAETWDIIKTISDDELLNETCQSFSGNTMSRLEGLWFVQDHMSNHKSKANLYIRVSGNEPPSYRYY